MINEALYKNYCVKKKQRDDDSVDFLEIFDLLSLKVTVGPQRIILHN